MTNRKSHTPFRRPWMTWMADMHSIAEKMRLLEPTTKIWMKIDPHYQRQKCRPMTLVSDNIRFMRIFIGILWRGASNDSGVIENVDFRGFWTLGLRLWQLRKWGQRYYIPLFSPLSPFQWPQNICPWMTLTGYLALNSVFAPVWLAEPARVRKIIAWKIIKINTYCQQCKSSAAALVSGDIRFARILYNTIQYNTIICNAHKVEYRTSNLRRGQSLGGRGRGRWLTGMRCEECFRRCLNVCIVGIPDSSR